MPKSSKPDKKPIEQYDHKGKERCNNPPVGLVTPETDIDSGKKTYAYDPINSSTLRNRTRISPIGQIFTDIFNPCVSVSSVFHRISGNAEVQ